MGAKLLCGGRQNRFIDLTTGEILARLEAEQANPVADVVILASWSDGLSMKADGQLESYTPANADKVNEGWIDEDSMLFGSSASAVGVIYNTTVVPELSADWAELADAQYKDRDKNGRMAQSEYLVFEIPELSKPALDSPSSEKPIPVKPATDVPTSGNPMQINTNQVTTHQENTHLNNTPSINHSGTGRRNDGTDWVDERERYREIIEENIEYEIMKDRPDGDRLGEIVEIMLDAVCSTAPTIRINGEDMPQQVVKSRFLKLDSSHIEYVFHAMKECPSNIRNIRAYLLTTLYNAPATMDNFYSAKVNHDFNGW